MTYILAVIGSVTTASRLKHLTEQMGCKEVRVIHTPTAIHSGGCSYSVKVPEKCRLLLTEAISKSGIKIKELYREAIENGESVYIDISG